MCRTGQPDSALNALAGVMALFLSVLLGEHWALPHARGGVVGLDLPGRIGSLIAFSAYRYVVERVSPTLAADLCVCQSAGRAVRRLVAGR